MKKKLLVSLLVIILTAIAGTFVYDFLRRQGLAPGGETGPATQCQTDADCYCRIFNGAEFLPGKDESICCIPNANAIDQFGCNNVQPNHCAQCPPNS